MKPNILYISDDYGKNVAGVKISIFNEMKRRNYDIIWQNKSIINKENSQRPTLKNIIKSYNINQVWLAHSGLVLPVELKQYCEEKNILVIGFGFSDPNYFDYNKRFYSYDVYITNSILIYYKYRVIIPCIYNPPACDFNFHKVTKGNTKNTYASIIGRGIHPYMDDNDKFYRIQIAKYLVSNKIDLKIFGKDWKPIQQNNQIEGKQFLKVINSSYVGIDLQGISSPLGRRMFEYSGCIVPIITRKRDEVFLHLEEDKEVLTYETKEELLDKLKFYNNKRMLLTVLGINAYNRCKKDHNISNRIDHLTKELNTIFGEKLF